MVCPFSAGDCENKPVRSHDGLIPGLVEIFCMNPYVFFGYPVILYSRSLSYKY